MPISKPPCVGIPARMAGGRDRQERRDDPERLVAAIRRMPGFHGIRRQQWALFTLGKNCWDRTQNPL
ncbi:MAG: hypothetical protein ACYCQM_06365 [Acidithiobacillus sp.]